MKHKLLDIISNRQTNNKLTPFKSGDVIKVFLSIIEEDKKTGKEKRRIQIFEGLVIEKRGEGINKTFTVRKIFDNIGIERTFALNSPLIEKIEILNSYKARRNKLYYMRGRNSITKV